MKRSKAPFYILLMIDRQYLQDLLPILKIHGVSSFKLNGLELTFHVEPSRVSYTPEMPNDQSSMDITIDTLKAQEEAMPVDLRADSLMDQDKILNWSSPDQTLDDLPLPLTGEEPL